MAGRVVKGSGTKGLFKVLLMSFLVMASIGLGFVLTDFFIGERGTAQDFPPLVSQGSSMEGDRALVVVAEAARSVSPPFDDTADPIDQILSRPSPYETTLTDSRPKGGRSSASKKVQAQKPRPSKRADIGTGNKGRGNRPQADLVREIRSDSSGGNNHLAGKNQPEHEDLNVPTKALDHTLSDDEKIPRGGQAGPEGEDSATDAKTGGKDAGAGGQVGDNKTADAGADKFAGRETKVHLFGTVALFPKAITAKTAPQWYRVMMSQQSPPPIFSNGTAKRMPEAVAKRWFALRKKIETADALTQAKEVNKFFNTWPYRTDDVVWGVPEYWATPEEFLEKSGDCEDYAITKYYALRSLGISADQMRIVAVKETIRGIGHAVLAFFHNDTAYILDNLSPYVLEHTVLKNYRPQFSVNENYRWGHARIVNKK